MSEFLVPVVSVARAQILVESYSMKGAVKTINDMILAGTLDDEYEGWNDFPCPEIDWNQIGETMKTEIEKKMF